MGISVALIQLIDELKEGKVFNPFELEQWSKKIAGNMDTGKLVLHLYNGSKTKESWNSDSPYFIDDWKPEERFLGPFDSVQLTFGTHLKCHSDEETIDLYVVDDFIYFDGCYFGDLNIEPFREDT